ncbi:imidazole glycerol phosphate synthase subunit HisH [Colwellia psychrerythraea]|uniref:Imidazole glycerol phosphate synthase, glutamine amidotransferase subunit n=1 Tax=Colwellia psychrerythraea TaxID=28229 RepID=A0A099L2C2_COLPS|nr:imidazole glycerol phosphate synthase subunit HisH [Colwellia psychrerythraea]KGJ97006.1 imidazole glycerol phosphate synthase, glutamine amidotransferase subunit [Colwellia psychrerythraea]
MVVDILDIGSGNIRSIRNWIERVNIATRIVTKATEIESEFLILPGVGSAGSYMKRIKEGSFDQAILEHVQKGNRLLGICLGFQILAESSEEDGGVEGLNLMKGYVKKLDKNSSHNGWENFNFKKDEMGSQSFHSQCKLTRKKMIQGRVFFNHEYGFINQDDHCFSKPISENFQNYSSMIVKDNIIGMQFHPEKSQNTGLDLISMIL